MINSINSTNNNSLSFQCIHPMSQKKGITKTQALAAAGTVAAVTAGVVYRKPIMKAVKNINFKKMWQNTKEFFSKTAKKVANLFKKEKSVRTAFNGEMANQYGFGAEGQKIAKETLRLKEQAQVELANNIINNVERIKASKMNRIGEDRRIFYDDLLRNFDQDEALKNIKK